MQEFEYVFFAREQRGVFKLLDVHGDIARLLVDHQRPAGGDDYRIYRFGA